MNIFGEDLNLVKEKVQLKIGSLPSTIIAQSKALSAVKPDEEVSLSFIVSNNLFDYY